MNFLNIRLMKSQGIVKEKQFLMMLRNTAEPVLIEQYIK